MLAVQLYLIFRFVPDDGTRFLLGLLSFIVLASVALYMWHAEKITKQISKPSEWAATIAASVFLGALSFGCDMLIGVINYPALAPFRAATKAGGPFGFGLTVLLCPGLTIVAVAGFVQALVPRGESR